MRARSIATDLDLAHPMFPSRFHRPPVPLFSGGALVSNSDMPRGPVEILMRRVLGPVVGLFLFLLARATFAQANEHRRLLVDRDQGAETCFPALDGVYHEEQGEVVFRALPRLSTREVGAVLEQGVRRMARYLARRGLLGVDSREGDDGETEPTLAQGHAALCASAASGQSPPAGPELRRRGTSLAPLVGKPLAFDKPLCASVDGFTLHAATRAGGLDGRAREALLRYVLRPPIAQERITQGPDGLVRIALKRPFSDGTVAIDLDPLSLLSRLAASVPAPRMHTVRYAGVLASASKLRRRIVPKPPAATSGEEANEPKLQGCRYRSWAELLGTLGIDALECPSCQGRMRILALVREPNEVRRFLRAAGEVAEPPHRAPARGPPYWASRALRIRSGADAA